jgi:predicted TIM-barrel enzyme
MNAECVAEMMELRSALVEAARTFADYMRKHSPQLAVAMPLDQAQNEWLALGKPETICRMLAAA